MDFSACRLLSSFQLGNHFNLNHKMRKFVVESDKGCSEDPGGTLSNLSSKLNDGNICDETPVGITNSVSVPTVNIASEQQLPLEPNIPCLELIPIKVGNDDPNPVPPRPSLTTDYQKLDFTMWRLGTDIDATIEEIQRISKLPLVTHTFDADFDLNMDIGELASREISMRKTLDKMKDLSQKYDIDGLL